MIVGLTRIRNEALIIHDTISHFLQWCSHVIVYDDFSTDNTVEIVRSFGDKVTLIEGTEWRLEREVEETRHRKLLLEKAKERGHEWCLYFDADERLCIQNMPDFTADAYSFGLYDGYMTPERQEPYTRGKLEELPRMWGSECREIIMLFRTAKATFKGLNMRPPLIDGKVEKAEICVKHYGKCLSIQHWEETCDYYAKHFKKYSEKWEARRGKAIHTVSDFNSPLYEWEQVCRFTSRY